jgi:hypothetical protein
VLSREDITADIYSGRGGAKITEIRRLSGSRISIAKVPHDDTGERMFTIVGTAESTERALMLLYSQVSIMFVYPRTRPDMSF